MSAARYAATRIELTGPTSSGGVARIVKASTARSCVAEAIAKIVMITQKVGPITSGIAESTAIQIAMARTAVTIQRR